MKFFKNAILMMVSLIFCFSIGDGVLAMADVGNYSSSYIEENITSNTKTLLKRKSKRYKPKKSKSKYKYKKYSNKSGLKSWKKILKVIIIVGVLLLVIGGIFIFIKSRS